jgi:hypothetical protein
MRCTVLHAKFIESTQLIAAQCHGGHEASMKVRQAVKMIQAADGMSPITVNSLLEEDRCKTWEDIAHGTDIVNYIFFQDSDPNFV